MCRINFNTGTDIVNINLHAFVTEYLSVCAGAMAFVVLIAFLSIPYSLRAHPGETAQSDVSIGRHMS